ncbi:hypothetical protein CSB09_01795 [Candidatus Gracilibacteria bacterium]|nr:MAG: hypothetical protein CSB09_01795 [Candidatus Gracilibacteria bacterium]
MKYTISILLSCLVLVSCTQNQDTPTPTPSNPSAPVAQENENMLVFGSGNHTVQIFSDFQCPACISSHKAVFPLFEKFAQQGRLKIEYRQFPLTTIHQNAYNDALALYCVAAVSKDWKKYADALYTLESQKAGKKVSDADRVELAKSIGITNNSIESCLANGDTKKYVNRDMKIGDSIRISGTPTYVLDGNRLDMKIFRDEETFNSFFERILGK